MSKSQIVQEVENANAKYVASFGVKGKLALPPGRRFAV
ncbi:carbonic anhydrase, partial [bacterium]|nr:carbonic anhydrase [bacterium]